MNKLASPRVKIITAMLIWGSVGLLVRKMNLNSIQIAFFRALFGSIFLLLISLIIKDKVDKGILKRNLPILLASGFALGINWAALFQAMKYTTISNAILSNYMAPVFMVVLSFLILKEKINIKKIICIGLAIFGLYLVVKAGDQDTVNNYNHAKGIMFGLIGATLYSIVVILNKHIKELSPFQTTLSQLSMAALALLPIVISQGVGALKGVDSRSWIYIIILGVIHTGMAYYLYFPSIQDLEGQSIAVLSYLDPISSIILAAIFLKESMTIVQSLGGALILISVYVSER